MKTIVKTKFKNMTGQDYLLKWIKETYPLCDSANYAELDYCDMQKFAVWLVKLLTTPHSIKSLPEYNEILYHAKTLTNEQFMEYWNEVQGNVL